VAPPEAGGEAKEGYTAPGRKEKNYFSRERTSRQVQQEVLGVQESWTDAIQPTQRYQQRGKKKKKANEKILKVGVRKLYWLLKRRHRRGKIHFEGKSGPFMGKKGGARRKKQEKGVVSKDSVKGESATRSLTKMG